MPLDLDFLEFTCTQELVLLNALSSQVPICPGILNAMAELHGLINAEKDRSKQHMAVVEFEEGPSGRQRMAVSSEHLCQLLELNLSVPCIAKLLGISRSTLYRRMAEVNLSPHCGYRMMKALLQARGLRVQYNRIRTSMHRVDTSGIVSRTLGLRCINRRTYSVPGPHTLMHIDTNHKLIRYNIVIFGGIDGFSRKVMYLGAATNNLASTALAFFQGSIEKFGFPLRVRGDQGVENVDIARLMFTVRGTGRSSFISGKSVHNQRIERLWRDLWVAVTSIYYDVLHYLEEEGFLSIGNTIHIFCCHYVFMPRLQNDLDTFRSGWDNHPLRTEGHMTPNQLWVLGFARQPVPTPDNTEDMELPSIEWEDSGLPCEDHSSIVVPDTVCPLTEGQMSALRDAINPKAASQSFGSDIYIAAVRFCGDLLREDG
ncbi:uncharacterized protein LOC121654829 isoform X2 [Melanotaenia boesemani]|uniref:uncharacterized protein LOC121654829 isoform X2 n=1 Tax=Melanotaenia boesemani TaxID=1250792 RepID=UPI001C044C09|nr:uncharacterized protein LOC121654829 isoform X2 [Melanotaenia boesemani]